MSPPEWLRAAIIHEDHAVLAFNKPAGLASQGGRGQTTDLESLLAHFADRKGRQPHLAHRLDADTSGVVVAGKTKAAVAFLNAVFANREAQKTYLAILCGGAPEPPSGVIDLPLAKTRVGHHEMMRVAVGGQSAVTRYETLSAHAAGALVRLSPETGRMHQLRAHCAAIGRPIAGDRRYGGLFSLGAQAVPGLMLHAAALTVPHPDGGVVSFVAPPPRAFAALAQGLGLVVPTLP
jgi:tRNA pseudouridine32 synthase/23S rRNA pseudouridine746 synthase